MSSRTTLATFVATLLVIAIFVMWPGLDLIVADWFHVDGAFFGASRAARAYRDVFWYGPFVVLAYAIVAALSRVARRPLPGAAWFTGRGVAYMVVSLLLGPGLLVNVGLKDHWGRPRPVQVSQFGGPMEFRPIWRTDGACATNCSFVSGEVSTDAWLLAPASLAPPPLRAPAFAMAIAATALTALGRMAFGGHFLSDCLLAALLSALVTQALYRFMRPRGVSSDDRRVAPDRPKS